MSPFISGNEINYQYVTLTWLFEVHLDGICISNFFVGSLKKSVNLKDSKHFYVCIKVKFRNLGFENRSSIGLCHQHPVAGDACGGSVSPYHHRSAFFNVTICLCASYYLPNKTQVFLRPKFVTNRRTFRGSGSVQTETNRNISSKFSWPQNGKQAQYSGDRRLLPVIMYTRSSQYCPISVTKDVP
jgi:hypothetical protein